MSESAPDGELTLEEAREALGDGQISVRAAATRTLAREGVFDDVQRLVTMATADKSPSVRLYAAAAATSILMRGRGAYDQQAWGEEHRKAVLDWVGGSDPARTPSLLLCYAAFPETTVIKRLTRMLRDPRYGVRAGAVAALRRMALSGAATREEAGLREWVGEALENRKMPIDAAVELVRIVGEAGWDVLIPRAREIGPGVEDALGLATERIEARHDPASWAGLWVDEGRDVMDERPPERRGWTVVPENAQPVDGRLEIDGRVHRLIWAPRPASEGSYMAIQADGRTLWRKDGKDLVEFVVEADTELSSHADHVATLMAMLDSAEGAHAARARALLLARCGQGDEALALLEVPLASKKPRNDLRFIAGLAYRAKGDTAAAREMFEGYLERAKKKEPWRAEAESYLQE